MKPTNRNTTKTLSTEQKETLLQILKKRFEKNTIRHKDILWITIQTKLEAHPEKLWSLYQMEITGGEPDFVKYDADLNQYVFFDCAAESPKERRSFCYDRAALDARKENKPKNSAVDKATEMGIELLDEQEYRYLQELGTFDSKTSSWLKTPDNIRKLGGAIFGDFRYGTVFIYHNGVQSYYAARGFRGLLKV